MIVQVERNKDLLGGGAIASPSQSETIHNVQIVDASGSMSGSKYKSAIEALNAENEELKQNKEVKYTSTIIEFDSSGGWSRNNRKGALSWPDRTDGVNMMVHSWLSPINMIGYVNGCGASGGTPLLEATTRIIERLIKDTPKNDAVVVTIFTDGGETDWPRDYTPERLRKAIEDAKECNITVNFMGTENEMSFMQDRIGLSKGNTLVHNNTSLGIKAAYRSRSVSMQTYSKSVSEGGEKVVANFFSKSVEEDK
jgi:hypothetical protein